MTIDMQYNFDSSKLNIIISSYHSLDLINSCLFVGCITDSLCPLFSTGALDGCLCCDTLEQTRL